jgi:hypothetical protein
VLFLQLNADLFGVSPVNLARHVFLPYGGG